MSRGEGGGLVVVECMEWTREGGMCGVKEGE